MTVKQLSRDQLDELKNIFYYTDFLACKPHGIKAYSPDELPDEIIFEWYDEYTFTNDDFLCTANAQTDQKMEEHRTMTAYELIEELKKLPEDCEILIYDTRRKESRIIYDREPLSEIEHDADGTPCAWINTET